MAPYSNAKVILTIPSNLRSDNCTVVLNRCLFPASKIMSLSAETESDKSSAMPCFVRTVLIPVILGGVLPCDVNKLELRTVFSKAEVACCRAQDDTDGGRPTHLGLRVL